MSKKNLLVASVGLCALLILLTERSFEYLHKNSLVTYEDTYLNSLFILLLATIISTAFIYVRPQAYNLWFHRFFIWYFPVAYLLTFSFPTYGGIMETTKSGASVMFGGLMIFITVVWVGYNFFSLPRQK